MNHLTIIGNLTRAPETKTTSTGKSVTSFTVAVNRRKKAEGQPEADFFRVAAWGALGDNCQKYLDKGRKVAVVGPVSCRAYTDKNSQPAASMEVFAETVEFLSGRNDSGSSAPAAEPEQGGFTPVEPGELPF